MEKDNGTLKWNHYFFTFKVNLTFKHLRDFVFDSLADGAHAEATQFLSILQVYSNTTAISSYL